jgi:probable DNA metabolism protein
MSKKSVYIYDGSYQGLLSAVYLGIKNRIIPARIITEDNYRNDLFYDKIIIESSEENAEHLSTEIKKHISADALRFVFHAFHSELEKIEDYIYRYILMGFKLGEKIDNYLTEDYVRQVHEAAKKVRRESHRYKGLVRFKEAAGGKLYAAVEPDYNILILIAPHFKNRLSTQDWIIHDKRRESAVIYSAADKEWLLIDLKSDFEPELSEQENNIQDLWKSFFSAVSIKNRLNPRLQRQFMPKKYWKHLIEDPGSSRNFS